VIVLIPGWTSLGLVSRGGATYELDALLVAEVGGLLVGVVDALLVGGVDFGGTAAVTVTVGAGGAGLRVDCAVAPPAGADDEDAMSGRPLPDTSELQAASTTTSAIAISA
jgi:hypothetical protein